MAMPGERLGSHASHRGLDPAPTAAHAMLVRGEGDDPSGFEGLQRVIDRRTNCAARRLFEPGPSPAQLRELMALAAAAPDHGQLTPWRFVLVPPQARARLGDAFVAALLQRDPSATLEQLERAREKAFHAPVLLLAISVDKAPVAGISSGERLVSLGAAIQNVLLGATAQGWGTALASGQAMDAAALRTLFDLSDRETAICFMALGSLHTSKPRSSPRPGVEHYLTQLGGEPLR